MAAFRRRLSPVVVVVMAAVVAITITLPPARASAAEANSALSPLPPLPQTVAKLLRKYRIPATAVSLEVRELGGGAVPAPPLLPLLSHNAETARNPASLIKLLTTLAALELLGPGYQWETAYLADGVIAGGALRGDLILRGGGDPFITVEQMLGHVLALRRTGLVAIAGELVIDNSRFAPARHDRGAFDGEAERLYNVGPDAAMINLSATRFVIEPRGGDGSGGSGNGGAAEIRITAEPPLAGLEIVNRVQPEGGGCISRNAGWSYRMDRSAAGANPNPVARFRGAYRPRCGDHSFSRSILPNTEYAHRLFTALWRAMGGTFAGGYRVAKTPQSARLLLTKPSRPLADLITGINKFSNNVMSRQLLLGIAAELRGAPATAEAGIAAVREWLAASGVRMPGLVIENGSGLSRTSRATAAGLSALLERGWVSAYRPEFVSSLPLAAIDGTMRTRLDGTALRGRARIKTGSIDGVRSMAGYVHGRNGRHYSVVMIIDSGRVNFANGNAVQDALLRWVYARE